MAAGAIVTDPTPVPPLAIANNPVHPAVIDVAAKRLDAGVPPNVSVTLVSLTSVKAAGVIVV